MGVGAAQVLRQWWQEIERVVVPLQCAGCGAWNEVACAQCEASLAPVWAEEEASALSAAMPVCALGWYRGAPRHLVLAWKTAGRRDVEPLLRARLAEAVGWAMPRLSPLLAAGHPLWVLPAPSGLARTLRGRPGLVRLAPTLAQAFAHRGYRTSVVAALRPRGSRIAGQRGAGVRGRRRVHAQARVSLAGRRVVLFDDVMATGSTLQAAHDAVEAAGGTVAAAFVLAAAPSAQRHTRPRLSLGPDLD